MTITTQHSAMNEHTSALAGLDSIAFAEMLNTRFCHDMAGPISAIHNGLDYLIDESIPEEMRNQARDLLVLSSKEALAKLQTYRLAYGRASATGESSVAELKDIVQRYFLHGKVALDWPDGGFSANINNEIRRLLMNMILLVSRMLVYGGTLSVRKEVMPHGRRLHVSGAHEKVKHDPELEKILNGLESVGPTPHNVPVLFTAGIAAQRGIRLRFSASDTKVDFTAEYE